MSTHTRRRNWQVPVRNKPERMRSVLWSASQKLINTLHTSCRTWDCHADNIKCLGEVRAPVSNANK